MKTCIIVVNICEDEYLYNIHEIIEFLFGTIVPVFLKFQHHRVRTQFAYPNALHQSRSTPCESLTIIFLIQTHRHKRIVRKSRGILIRDVSIMTLFKAVILLVTLIVLG